jgi:hypothetical protein
VWCQLGAVNELINLKNETGLISPKGKGQCESKGKASFKGDVFLLRQSKIDPHETSFECQKDLATAEVQVQFIANF